MSMNGTWDCLAASRRPQGLCGTCRHGLGALILGLEDDYAGLSAMLARTGGAAGDAFRPPNKPESAPPINLAVDALRTDIVHTATAWEVLVREQANLSPRRDGAVREAVALAGAVRVLAAHLDLFSALPATEWYWDGLDAGVVRRTGLGGLRRCVRLHNLAQAALGVCDVYVRLPGTCPACAASALARDYGTDTVHCLWCDGRWTVDDYRRYVGLVVDWAS